MITSLQSHILDAANRAPSPHNTQPWSLKFKGDSLMIYVNQGRTLPAIDSKYSDILHAIGAMLENVLLTLSYLGYESEYANSENVSFEDPVISIRWRDSGKKSTSSEFYRMIPIRKTSRIAYYDKQIDPSILENLKALAGPSGNVFTTADAIKIKKIRDLVVSATLNQMEDYPVSRELYNWMRFSKKDARWYRDGLNAECMGWGQLEGLAAGIVLNPEFLKWFSLLKLNKILLGSVDSLAPKCPAICLFTIPEDNLRARIEAGRSLQRMWLFLASKDLVTHPISAAVDVDSTRPKTMETMGAVPLDKHVNLFRIGFSPVVARSPRLPADEILK